MSSKESFGVGSFSTSEKFGVSADSNDDQRDRSIERSISVHSEGFGSMSSRSESPLRESRSVSPSRSPSPNRERRRGRSKSRSPSRRRSGSRRSKSRSKSPTKFGEKDFRTKLTSQNSMKRRQNALAKVRGLKIDMSDWSKQELMDKIKSFAKWTVSKKTGACELLVQDKRLLNEDIEAIKELLRRNTEAQVITINNCGLTDEQFSEIAVSLKGQRHVKRIYLKYNLLGMDSVHTLIRTFSRASRPIEVIDTQGNTNMSFTEGRLLYSAFAGLISLNELPVREFQLEEGAVPLQVLPLPGKSIRNTEVAIVSMILEQLNTITKLELQDNLINAEGLAYLTDTISHCHTIIDIDISSNPLTENLALDEPDLSGVQALLRFFESSTRMQRGKWEQVEGIPPQIDELLHQALMANRAVKGSWDGDYFNNYAMGLIERLAPPLPPNKLKSWRGSIHTVDASFMKRNRLQLISVSVHPGSSTIQNAGMNVEEDEIQLEKVSQFVRPTIHY